MPTAPKQPPPPEPGSDADNMAKGIAPSFDPKNPKSREEREAEAFAALPADAQAGMTDQMKPPPVTPAETTS